MQRIQIKVIPRAQQNKIIQEKNRLKVYTTAPAIKNRANKQAIKLLAEFFNIKKTSLQILKGQKSREKIIEINKH